MADEKKDQVKWAAPKEPKPEIYTNFVHTSWTLYDVRLQLGLLVPTDAGVTLDFVVEQQGAVTFGWPQAKNLRDVLTRLVESYEKTNGEIKPLKLAPTPEVTYPAVAPIPAQPPKPLSK